MAATPALGDDLYRLIDIESSGGVSAQAGINDQGVVVGHGPGIYGSGWSFESGVLRHFGGGCDTFHDINESGWVVGWSGCPGAPAAWRLQGASLSGGFLPIPSGYGGHREAHAINNQGLIVGYLNPVNDGQQRWYPHYWAPSAVGAYTQPVPLGRLGDPTPFAVTMRVNNAGLIVGYATSADGGRYRPVKWVPSGVGYAPPIDLGTLGGTDGIAYGVSEGGVVYGWARDASGAGHAVLWTELRIRDVGMFGGTSASAADVSSVGVVAGTVGYSDSSYWPFLFKQGARLTLRNRVQGATGFRGVSAERINASGVIIGTGLRTEGSYRAVMLAPLVPIQLCPADMDNGSGEGAPDGGVTVDDLVFFLARLELGDARVDLDDGTGSGTPDAGVTIDDLIYFLARFETGC